MFTKILSTKIFFEWFISGHTISGLADIDYPTLDIGPSGQPLLKQSGIVNRVPLPPELVEHFGRKLYYFNVSQLHLLYYDLIFADMQSYCMMGIFPTIQRAWLSIDSDIYVWTYENR